MFLETLPGQASFKFLHACGPNGTTGDSCWMLFSLPSPRKSTILHSYSVLSMQPTGRPSSSGIAVADPEVVLLGILHGETHSVSHLKAKECQIWMVESRVARPDWEQVRMAKNNSHFGIIGWNRFAVHIFPYLSLLDASWSLSGIIWAYLRVWNPPETIRHRHTTCFRLFQTIPPVPPVPPATNA